MVNRQMINSWQTITIGSCVSKARKPLSSRAILIYFEFRSKAPPPRGRPGPARPHSLLSFAWTLACVAGATWTLTRPTNYLPQNTVFLNSEIIAVSFSHIISLFFVFLIVILCYYVIINFYKNYVIIIILFN